MASEWPAIIFARAEGLLWWAWPGSWNEEQDRLANLYLHRDAARAWQAFRDWLNGAPEQWQQYAEGMYAYGRQLGWEDV